MVIGVDHLVIASCKDEFGGKKKEKSAHVVACQ